MKRPWVKCRTV